jgi:hypothetical protein
MSRAPGKFVVHTRSPGAAMGTLDAFFVMRCFGAVSPDDIRATLKCSELTTAYRPEGVSSLVVVDPTSTFPSEATRHAALQAARDTRSVAAGLSIVILGDGFWASAIRGVVTTLTSISSASVTRRKVARYEEEGVDSAIEAIGESPQKYRGPLLAALNELKPAASASPSPSKASPSTPPPATSRVPPSSKRQAG